MLSSPVTKAPLPTTAPFCTSTVDCSERQEVGFPYFVGQFGTVIAGDSDNEYGYAVDARVKKYTIEVIISEVLPCQLIVA